MHTWPYLLGFIWVSSWIGCFKTQCAKKFGAVAGHSMNQTFAYPSAGRSEMAEESDMQSPASSPVTRQSGWFHQPGSQAHNLPWKSMKWTFWDRLRQETSLVKRLNIFQYLVSTPPYDTSIYDMNIHLFSMPISIPGLFQSWSSRPWAGQIAWDLLRSNNHNLGRAGCTCQTGHLYPT